MEHGPERAVPWRRRVDILRRIPGLVAAALAAVPLIGGAALAGHELGHYPSYYPAEIRIDRLDPAAAGKGLAEGTLQAYVGGRPAFEGSAPGHLRSVTSLESFVVLASGPNARFASPERRCAAARDAIAALRERAVPGFAFHPYPVTPYHADYLHHLDRVEAAKQAAGAKNEAGTPVTMHASGKLAGSLVPAALAVPAERADFVIEQVPVEDLVASRGPAFGPGQQHPLAKEGWFQAYRLLNGPAHDDAREINDRLTRGRIAGLAEQAGLERRLVESLTSDCARLVAGYTVREEFTNATFSKGVENIAYDAQLGLNAPVFLRTVKLQEYPWNGTLRIGVPGGNVETAWNPVAGFADPAGRLIWSAVADPAMIAFPFNASWIPNRVHFEVTKTGNQSGGVKVPPGALVPRPGTGALEAIGAKGIASAKVVYEMLGSPFTDGSEMDMADVLYPFAFIYRWGRAGASGGGNIREPALEAALAAMQPRLAGLRPVRVERTKKSIAPGLDIVQHTPVVELYLRDAPGDHHQIAVLAPPWSTVPWHLIVLMEEAVLRGVAAFSREEARRRGVPWLDLVRNEAVRARLLELAASFEQKGYRPDALRGFVGAHEARERWRALRAFAEKHGHFLVTNGPYRLREWTPDSVVLEAVREATYPLGFGSFDRYVNPPRAVIREAAREGGRIVVGADAELTKKVERHYEVRREPLTRATSHGLFGLLVVSRYLLIGPDGGVLKLDKMAWRDDGRFILDLPAGLEPGEYTLLLGVFLDGNARLPSTRLMRLHVGGKETPG